ncbi:carboxymuconolactone decarboxylase family protein [Mucilaginibacter mali]|uniref:Carboxymuconolactone decarboxylase family protein n=1 Tax=Mucilaginibacter mali TaxID=2740462 RepID=A0A7D4TVG4_9SPHI|nr:carboxymuconolactone decarboxylase family protein [Mucilaginibacter mali]QKJ30535.1 carboxymuconolactone decarboxylase family protein [Mucilaginibacter mali]
MQRITALNPEATTGASKELFNAIQTKLGMIPNMMRTMGNSPAVLEGYLGLNNALGKSSIGGKLGQLLAITVANANSCTYCNSAHNFIGEKMMHIDAASLKAAHEGRSGDAKIQAALDFARILVEKKGLVNDADVNALKNAGYSEAAIAEIIAHVGLNIFTNYFNNAADVLNDFPVADLLESAAI